MSSPPEHPGGTQVRDALVLGGGAAGLTAGLFLARHGRSVAIVDQFTGNHMINAATVENYPGFPEGITGADLSAAMQGQAMAAGAELVFASVTSLEQVEGGFRADTDAGPQEARTALVCTGSALRRLGVDGEERLMGRGVSECATCDGPLFQGKPVAVVGAGDSAADEVLALTEWAADVTMVLDGDAPTAQHALRRQLGEAANVRMRPDTQVVALRGDEQVTGIVLRDAAGTETVEEVSGVFVFVGLVPNTGFLEGIVQLDADGRVPVDARMATSVPGLFAAGDVRRDSASQFISAAGDGATAALAAHGYLG